MSSSQETLFDLVHRQKWAALAAGCAARADQIPLQDEEGFTALHWACMNDAPVRVVHALLRNDPSSSVATLRDKTEGLIPLHHAVYCGASADVILELVSSCPESASTRDLGGWNPLHYLCSALLNPVVGGGGRRMLSFDECRKRATATARCLLSGSGDPSAVSTAKDHANGKTPLCLLIDHLSSCGGGGSMEHYIDFCWDVISLLSRAAFYGSIDDTTWDENDSCGKKENKTKWPVVHAMAGMQPFRISLLRVAIKHHPEQVKLKDEREGNLPLHILASTPPSSREEVVAIELLIEKYPAAASVRNIDAQLPFGLAAGNGRTWKTGLKAILDAHPSALESRGLDLRVYPLLLEVLARDNIPSTLFEVLKAKPDLVQNVGNP